MMRKAMIMVIMAMALLFSGTAFAENLKVGVVDLQKILEKAPEVAKIRAALQKEFKPREEKLNRLAKSLKKDMDKLYRDGATLGASERESLQNRITKNRRDVQMMQANLQEDATNAQQARMQKFLKKVNDKLAVLAKKRHFDLVFLKDSMPYSSSKVDVTDDVIKMLKQG